jgi:hypothetical protein
MNLDALKPAPIMDTVRFESEPPGAEAKTSNGQTCKTPCALALPVNAPLTVTFTLNGYLPESESLEPVAMTGTAEQLRPNPVLVELTPAPPPKPVKKTVIRKKTTTKTTTTTVVKKPVKKPAAKPVPKPAGSTAKPAPAPAAATPAPAPATAAPADQQPAPGPGAPPPQR